MSESTSNSEAFAHSSGGTAPAGWVKLASYGIANEAELHAAVLAAEGIETQVFGANLSLVEWGWQSFIDVDLMVPQADAQRAREVLSRASIQDVEPAQEPEDAAPPVDEQGRALVPVAAFDNPTALRDAQTILASARIAAYAPRLVLRGEKPPGVGKRFVLRVAEQDLGSAQSLLAREAQEDQDEPHCPRCGSWRTISRKTLLQGLAGLVGRGGPAQIECLSCHYVGDATEFLQRTDN
jgi:hypothetical protein